MNATANNFHIIIPARYQSERLPGKLLMDLNGVTIIERVYRQSLLSHPKSITIATDNEAIFSQAKNFGANVIMTAIDHCSGTDRIAEVVGKGNFLDDDIIVNVQADEAFIDPRLIKQVAASLANHLTPMATLCYPVTENINNSNLVKVVRDREQNALYFSRSIIPFNRHTPQTPTLVYRHIGIYAYRAAFLLELVKLPICELEQLEMLEQLRVLWSGYKIRVEEACVPPTPDINTQEDLENAKQQMRERL